ncbi:hypothetical protein [Vibrio sp. 1CM23M]|uniref:hypothetical protein n=1 Tax=Vibrio sp. 1CM23M TaxID=2929164 RepID=UPI0020C17B77|nr:hypothetical protein [Vibrio sp. 1CM23M]MCK8072456.1 hypothetical protein [Vibrio sp. 1CM23M]
MDAKELHKTISLSYDIQVDYEISEGVILFKGSEFDNEYELFVSVADTESISNTVPMIQIDYILEDKDTFLSFKDVFENITLISGFGCVFKNDQYLSFDHGIFVERDQYVLEGIDFYDWFVGQIQN